MILCPPESLEHVACAIGTDVQSSEILEVIEFAVDHKLLFHGIKRAQEIQQIRNAGLQPETYWARGSRLFFSAPPTAESYLWQYSTSFFDYAHGRTPGGNRVWAMAITDEARVAQLGVTISGDEHSSEVHTVEQIAPDAFTLVKFEQPEVVPKELLFSWIHEGVKTRRLLEPGYHEMVT